MYFYPMGTSKSEDDNIVAYGIDFDTMYVIKAGIPTYIAKTMSFNTIYEVELHLNKERIPNVQIIKINKCEDVFFDDVDTLLDLAASSLDGIINDISVGGIVKLDYISRIDVGNHKTNLKASITGIPDRMFDITLDDLRWVEYWENQKLYAECDLIKEYLNKKKVFLFIEYGKTCLGDSLKCVSMVIR